MEEVETTTADSSSEEQIVEEVSSETEVVEDTTSEETQETESVEQPETKPTRAENRIRETIARAKTAEARAAQLERELQTMRGSQQSYEGIDDSGIDPKKYGDSVLEKARAEARLEASQATDRRIEALRAEQDFPELKSNRLVQRSAQGYIAEGYTPYQAAQLAMEDFEDFRTSESRNIAKRNEADTAIRRTTYTPKGTNNSKSGHVYTEAEIASMSNDEYEANHDKIMDQMSKNLIK